MRPLTVSVPGSGRGRLPPFLGHEYEGDLDLIAVQLARRKRVGRRTAGNG